MRVISAILAAWALTAQTPDNLLERGMAEFNRGEYAAAEASLEKAPDSPARKTFLALTRAATGRCDSARVDLAEQFEKLTQGDVRRLAGLALAQCDIARGENEEAMHVVGRLKTLYPSDADVLYQSARLHMKAWNDALYEMFQKTPGSYRVNQISAEIFEIEKRYSEAAAEYRKAIEKNPVALNLHFRLGRAILMESHAPDNLAAARREFEKELELNPGDAVAEYEVGQVLLVSQQPADALKRFERAVAISPDFPEALEALAKLKMDSKQYDEAIAILEKIVHLEPTSETAHYQLMLAYRNAGRASDAAREQAELDKLRRTPQGEFTDFLKRLGEKAPKQ